MPGVSAQTVLPPLAAIFVLWGAYRCWKTGKVYARSLLIAERSNDPVMFWIYTLGQLGLAVLLLFLAVRSYLSAV